MKKLTILTGITFILVIGLQWSVQAQNNNCVGPYIALGSNAEDIITSDLIKDCYTYALDTVNDGIRTIMFFNKKFPKLLHYYKIKNDNCFEQGDIYPDDLSPEVINSYSNSKLYIKVNTLQYIFMGNDNIMPFMITIFRLNEKSICVKYEPYNPI